MNLKEKEKKDLLRPLVGTGALFCPQHIWIKVPGSLSVLCFPLCSEEPGPPAVAAGFCSAEGDSRETCQASTLPPSYTPPSLGYGNENWNTEGAALQPTLWQSLFSLLRPQTGYPCAELSSIT